MEPTQNPQYPRQKNNILLPISIILAGALIAGAIYLIKRPVEQTQIAGQTVNAHPEDSMTPITADDHILGNPNAPVVMVEYSDTDCPFCQAFQPTLHRIMDTYGKDGKVAWVYRHFAFHPKAPKEAEATECVAEIGGNTKFWQFVDLLFSKKNFKQDPYLGVDPSQLPSLAASIGIDKAKFSTCLNSGKYADKIKKSYDDAIKSGAQGTPYTILVTKTGKVPITTGAIPFESLNNAIAALLNEKPQ
jgi:protein-disulfide isomerase